MGASAVLAFLVLQAAAPAPAVAPTQTAWPYEEDIPEPAPAVVGLAGSGEPDIVRYLMAQGAFGVRIAPDGRTIAYLSTLTGQPQVWTVDAEGGAPRQLTFGAGVDGIEFAPDGAGLLVEADSGGDEKAGMNWLAVDGRRERPVLARSDAYRLFGDWSPDGGRLAYASTERNGRDFDVWVADLTTGATRRAFDGSYAYLPTAWRPGSEQVLISETRGEDANDVHLLDLATGELRTLFEPEAAAAYRSFDWLPDGSGFYLTTNQEREFLALASYDLASGTLTFVETPDHDIEWSGLSPDGRYLAWQSDEGGFSRLHARDLTSGRTLQTPRLPAGVYTIDMAEAAPVASVRISGPGTPGDVWVWNLASSEASRAVASTGAGLDLDAMAVPEVVRFEARDGVMLNGLLYRPRGLAKGAKAPVYLQLHGGPTYHARAGYSSAVQYLVARGIAVLDFNYRGSTGSGKSYARLNDKRLRPNELNDLADAAAWIAARPDLDGDRMAVGGGSYGGYLANAVLGAHPDLFVAGVSMVGTSDWVAGLEETSPALAASDREEYGDINDPADRAFFRSISPINTADRIRAPMLVQHGANDPRNPVSQSDRLVVKVREAGTPVAYLRYPDEGHGFSGVANRVHFYRTMAAFLEERFGMGEGR